MPAMLDWTVDKVLALAPDAGSASAGQGLASARKWTSIGASDRAIWGLCQGSGKDPYQARVDLSEPAFKCSCPSRKFPCKHGLGLLLLFAKESASFKKATEPGWVSEWIDGRAEKADKKAEKAKAAAEAPVDEKAQAKRAAARDDKVRQGVAECRTWLGDMIRRGLAAAQADAGTECERVAARMIDAQAPGLAGLVRRIPIAMASGSGWEVRALDLLGRIHLLLVASERLSELPPPLAGDARVALGYNQPKDEVLAGQGIADSWVILGQAFEEDARLTVRRTWLWGQRTSSPALVLDFAVGNQPLDPSLVSGTAFDGELVFYPSGAPLRAIVKSRGEGAQLSASFNHGQQFEVSTGLARFATGLGANPWLSRWPLVVRNALVVRSEQGWFLRQGEECVPLSTTFARGSQIWRLLAATGGREATIVAEWDGEAAEPIGVFSGESGSVYVGLATRWAA